jgi:hypothetical protein
MAESQTHNDLYSVLGLTSQATSQDIRTAYQRLVGEIVAGHVPTVQRQAIEEAFETLGDPIRRLRYDAQAAAPAPPRFQMPPLRMPGRRIAIQMPAISIRRPRLPHVDPLIGAAVGLVVVVALVVLLVPLVRGRSGSNAPAQSVADLVGSATATPTASASAAATAPRTQATPILGVGGGLGSGTGGSLVPLSPQGSPGGLLTPNQPPAATTGEPPFLTGSAIVDSLRAVLAASAVRNGPSQAGVPPSSAAAAAPVRPVASNPPPNPVPAGVPLTTVGALPPVVSAPSGASGTSGSPPLTAAVQPTAPPPTPTPAPNRIAIPGGPVTSGAPANRNTGSSGQPASGPNHFVSGSP